MAVKQKRKTGIFKRPEYKKPRQSPPGGGAALPAGIETFIDMGVGDPLYELSLATKGEPDHGPRGGCRHSPTASSWVSALGLVVLTEGGLGLYVRFHDGARIAYVWKDDDDCAKFYQQWKKAPSKGKYLHRYLYQQAYVPLG